MPRKNNTIPVVPWPKLKEGKRYEGKVKQVRPEKATRLHVTIQNLDLSQFGRIHEINLPLPIHPGNRICIFLEACGIEARTVGATICLDQLVNAIVGMRFRGLAANGVELFDFERLPNSPPPRNAAPAPGMREEEIPF